MIIWLVRVGEQLYVRSVNGRRRLSRCAGWCQRTVALLDRVNAALTGSCGLLLIALVVVLVLIAGKRPRVVPTEADVPAPPVRSEVAP